MTVGGRGELFGRRCLWAFVIAVSMMLAGGAAAQTELVRPHVPGYETPDWQQPLRQAAPRDPAWEVWDLAFLAVALVLASYFAIGLRSRRALLILAGVSVFWLGFVRQGCVCPVGAIQNVALTLADPSYAIPLTVAVLFVLPILMTVFFGRTFCAAVCPLGAFQELLAVAPIRVPRWTDEVLGLFPYAYLGLGLLTAVASGYFLVCHYDPFVSFFRLGANAEMWIFSIGFLLLGLIVARPYCRFLCPLGAIFRMIAPLSRWHLRIAPTQCVVCRLCEEVCPYNAIRRARLQAGLTSPAEGSRSWVPWAAVNALGVLLAALVGYLLGPAIARVDFRVQLAEQIWLEENGLVTESTDASEVFRKSGREIAELFREAAAIENRYRWGGLLIGLWFGVVMAAKCAQLHWPAFRREYEPDRAKCYSCGRCFRFCPVELQRLGLIDAEDLAVYVRAKGGTVPQETSIAR